MDCFGIVWVIAAGVFGFLIGLLCMCNYDEGYGLDKEELMLAIQMALHECQGTDYTELILELQEYAGNKDSDIDAISSQAAEIVRRAKEVSNIKSFK